MLSKTLIVGITISTLIITIFLRMGSTYDHYGLPIKNLPLHSINDINRTPQMYLNTSIRIDGKVIRQCSTSGDWFILEDEWGQRIKVEMGHLGMRFPQKLGKQALVEGRLLRFREAWEFVGNNVKFEK